jgi:hypothetical protein
MFADPVIKNKCMSFNRISKCYSATFLIKKIQIWCCFQPLLVQMSISQLVLKIDELELKGIIIIFWFTYKQGKKYNATERGECRIWRCYLCIQRQWINIKYKNLIKKWYVITVWNKMTENLLSSVWVPTEILQLNRSPLYWKWLLTLQLHNSCEKIMIRLSCHPNKCNNNKPY